MNKQKFLFALTVAALSITSVNTALAGKPEPKPKPVEIVNSAVPVVVQNPQSDVTVSGTVDVSGSNVNATISGMPDVNVANTPDVNVANAPDVFVINDATNPLPVLNVNDAMEPFQMRLSFNINAGSTQNQIDLPVPAGKRLVFEHASSRVQGPSGQQYLAQIQTSVFPNGSTRGVHWLVLTLQMNIPGLDIFTASQPMRIYAQPSISSSLFIVTRSTSAGTAFAEVTISGYLVDL